MVMEADGRICQRCRRRCDEFMGGVCECVDGCPGGDGPVIAELVGDMGDEQHDGTAEVT